jgi:phosphoserine phosphatase RsbU/P
VSSDEALEDFYGALLDDDAEALYERAPCGYLSTTPDGTIIKVNQTFLTWTGYQRAELVGCRAFAELLTAGGRIFHETHYAPMLRLQGTAREIALDIVGSDGRRLPALVNSVLERDHSGAPAIIRTAIFDATERREYERELLRAKQRAEESEAHATLLARTLQQTLIPPALPDIAGLDVAAIYRPAGTGEEIGGDFYDVFETGPNDWMFAIGDVQGKGVEAAVVTALVRYTIRAAAVRHARPSQVLETVNEVLLRHDTDRLCTVAIIRLREAHDGWIATVSSGGHPLPVLQRAGGDPTGFGRPGALLGVFTTTNFHDDERVLRSGDRVVVYTDGVSEARRGGTWFGDAGVQKIIAGFSGSAAMLTERIVDEVLELEGGLPHDDIAIVAVQVV